MESTVVYCYDVLSDHLTHDTVTQYRVGLKGCSTSSISDAQCITEQLLIYPNVLHSLLSLQL